MLSLLTAVLLTQAPLGIGQVPTSTLPSFPPASYVQHIFIDSTKKCLMYSDGLSWKCLVEEGDPVSGLESSGVAPSSPSAGRTYYDSSKGCLQTWTGSAWAPVTCPLLSAPAQPTPPNTLLSPASTPPSTSTVGATYFDTSAGCLRTWNGTAYSMCPSAAPTAPQILLAPAASDPTTSVVGATYWNTSGKCLKTWDGAAFTPALCPPTTTLRPPSAASPPGGASVGDVFNDTTLGCARRYSGSSWGDCLTVERCQSFTATGLSIPILGVSTTTVPVTLQGARVNAPCQVTSPGGFPPIGASAVCYVSAANTLQVRWNSSTGALSSLVAIPNGTYYACTSVLW